MKLAVLGHFVCFLECFYVCNHFPADLGDWIVHDLMGRLARTSGCYAEGMVFETKHCTNLIEPLHIYDTGCVPLFNEIPLTPTWVTAYYVPLINDRKNSIKISPALEGIKPASLLSEYTGCFGLHFQTFWNIGYPVFRHFWKFCLGHPVYADKVHAMCGLRISSATRWLRVPRSVHERNLAAYTRPYTCFGSGSTVCHTLLQC